MGTIINAILVVLLLPFAIIINLLKQPKYGLVQKRRRRR